jgi:hypothetical protein
MHVLQLLLADALLPAKTSLVLIYSGLGCVGGVMAGCGQFAAEFPSLGEILKRSIVGGGTGLIAGAGCLAKFGDCDSCVWWSMAICGVAGFIGPAAAWKLWGNNGPKVNGGQ